MKEKDSFSSHEVLQYEDYIHSELSDYTVECSCRAQFITVIWLCRAVYFIYFGNGLLLCVEMNTKCMYHTYCLFNISCIHTVLSLYKFIHAVYPVDIVLYISQIYILVTLYPYACMPMNVYNMNVNRGFCLFTSDLRWIPFQGNANKTVCLH